MAEGSPELFEGPFKHRKGELRLGAGERFADEQIPRREVRDR
jgi:hypothetical protein